MFGENGLFGASKMGKDNAYRIIIPERANASAGDILVFVCEGEHVAIYESKELLSRIEKIEDTILRCENMDLRNTLKAELKELRDGIIKQAKVDKSNRVVISGIYDDDDKLVFIGQGKKALIMPQEQYEEYNKKK